MYSKKYPNHFTSILSFEKIIFLYLGGKFEKTPSKSDIYKKMLYSEHLQEVVDNYSEIINVMKANPDFVKDILAIIDQPS
jgi:lysyl-tRNA synthetase class I